MPSDMLCLKKHMMIFLETLSQHLLLPMCSFRSVGSHERRGEIISDPLLQIEGIKPLPVKRGAIPSRNLAIDVVMTLDMNVPQL